MASRWQFHVDFAIVSSFNCIIYIQTLSLSLLVSALINTIYSWNLNNNPSYTNAIYKNTLKDK